jgi:hypothetical protein
MHSDWRWTCSSVESLTEGVPGAHVDTFDSYDDAVALYTLAFGQGLVSRMVEAGGIHDQVAAPGSPPRRRRSSGESRLWDEVSDIDEIAAKWAG